MTALRSIVLSALFAPLAALSATQTEEPPTPTLEVMARWAEATYPALASATSVPENLYVGFAVNEHLQVLHHSAVLRPGPRPMLQDVAAMFPGVSVVGAPMGGIAEVPSPSGGQTYRVIWIMVPSQ